MELRRAKGALMILVGRKTTPQASGRLLAQLDKQRNLQLEQTRRM